MKHFGCGNAFGEGGRSLKKRVSFASLAVFLFLGVWFIFKNQEQFSQISINLAAVPGFVLAAFALYVFRGEMQQALVLPVGVRLCWWERMGLTVITTVANNILPASAGVLFKFGYLKKVHGIVWSVTALYLVINRVALMMCDSMAVLVVLAVGGYGLSYLSLVYAALLVVCVGVLLLPADQSLLCRFKVFANVVMAWKLFREEPVHGARIVLVSLGIVAANALLIWCACHVLCFPVGVGSAFLLAGVRSSSILINITPGSLGVTESFLALTSSLIGMGAVQGVVLSALLRVGILGVGLVLFLPLYFPMKRSMARAAAQVRV